MDNKKYIVGYVDFNEVLRNQKRYANEFSQGNILLRNLLLRLWGNNIETLSCGNKEEEDGAALIAFYIPFSQKELIYKLLESVYNVENAIVSIGKGFNRDSIYIDIRSYWGGYDIFYSLFQALSKVDREVADKSNGVWGLSTVKPCVTEEDKEEIVGIVELIQNFKYDDYIIKFEKNNCASVCRYQAAIARMEDRLVRPRYIFSDIYNRNKLKETKEFTLSL